MSRPTDAAREARLLEAFVDLADTLVEDYDVVEVLHELVESCVDLLDATAAGLVLIDQHGGLRLMASTSEDAARLELFQLRHDEGPCVDCVRTGEPVSVAVLATATERWPRFVPEAGEFRSVHAVPLRLRKQIIGALNLFGGGAMDPRDLRVARALADTVTIGILQERAIRRGEVLSEQLQTALDNRITIEQAKGLLAHAGDVDMNEAFRRLRFYGRATSTRLSEIAHHLVTGTLAPRVVLEQQAGKRRS
jgi:hypothetical protein